MFIEKRSIRSLRGNLPAFLSGRTVVCGVRVASVSDARLSRAGFQEPPKFGDRLLPAVIGPVTRRNAEGETVVRRDQPMETAYRQAMWRWQEWHGRYESVERTKVVDVPYKRYPRQQILPPALEYVVGQAQAGALLIVLPSRKYEGEDALLLHSVNLLLECFGHCEVFTEDLKPVLKGKTRSLNWHILPPGRRPWPDVRVELEPVLRAAPEGNQSVIEARLDLLGGLEPEFIAIGQAGFRGYLIFAFPSRDLFVLESTAVNNATYVLGAEWESLSQMTKAELLAEELHRERIVHRASWSERVVELFQTGAADMEESAQGRLA